MTMVWLDRLLERLKPYVTLPSLRPPQGVCIVRPSGVVVACKVLREPQRDDEECTHWIAIPLDKEYTWSFGDTLQIIGVSPGRLTVSVVSPLWRSNESSPDRRPRA